MSDTFILLTASQADAVRGESSPGAWLAPVRLVDGETWVLPGRILAGQAHESKWPILAALPQRAIAAEEWPPSEIDD